MLDTVFPRIPGDVGNPATFPFPVLYRVVKGATPGRVVKEADPLLIEPFMEAARHLEKDGVRAIATSCGFLAVFQRELADAVDIPLFSSSLLEAHVAHVATGSRRRVGILTASARSLTERHFTGVGIENIPRAVMGMDEAEEFTSVFLEGKKTLNVKKVEKEMIMAAKKMVKNNPDIGAVVMECANMPPYAKLVQDAVGLPVFDATTMILHMYGSLHRQRFN